MGLLRIRAAQHVLLVCVIICSLSRPLSASDDQVLLEFKANLTDRNGILTKWNTSVSHCSWPGIKCVYDTDRVEQILLNRSSIHGTLSPAIGLLTELRVLNMMRNNLSSSIPASIINCTKLTDINLGENSLTGDIPQDIGRLNQLTILRLHSNKLTGSIPESIGNLRRLKRLRLEQNQLDGGIPRGIGNCTLLVFLEVFQNRLNGNIPSEVGNLRRLSHLSLHNNNLSGEIPPDIGKCSSLRKLDISHNQFYGSIPRELGQLRNLDLFQVSSGNLTGALPAELGNITGLLEFDVSSNRLSGAVPSSFRWKQVTTMNLSSNSLTGPLPDSFGEMRSLQVLDLSRNSLTSQLPVSIGLLPDLSKLLLEANSFEGPLPPALGSLGALKQLRASGNRFNGSLPSSICNSNLTALDLSRNRLVETLQPLKNCSTLQSLDVSRNQISGDLPVFKSEELSLLDVSSNRITGPLPSDIEHLKELKVLVLADNQFTATLPHEIGFLLQLETLNISTNAFQGDLPSLQGLELLKVLDMSKNNLTGQVPSYFGTFLNLEILDLSHNNFTGGIPSEFENLRKLRTLNVSSNRLSGQIPSVFSTFPATAFANNLQLCGLPLNILCSQPPPPAPNFPPTPSRSNRRSVGRKVGLAFIVFAGVFLFASSIFLLITYRRLHRRKPSATQENKFADRVPLLFTEVEKATEGFSDANIIGTGPHGSTYKGIFGWEKILAVKVVRNEQETEENNKNAYYYIAAARKLNRIRHPNVVKLDEFLLYRGLKIFLYDYMPNRSLGEALHAPSGPKLHWNTRYKIALGAAQGLSYLHHQNSIVHCDIKSNNVLLDSAFGARIADVGLAKLIKDSRNLSSLNKSFGYMAPDPNKVSQKADVYSFGVVLLEILTGRKPMLENGKSIVEYVRNSIADDQPLSNIVDPILRNVNGPFQEEISTVFKVAVICTDQSPSRRPSMKEVVEVLSRIRKEPGGLKLRSLRSFIHRRSFVLLSTQDDDL